MGGQVVRQVAPGEMIIIEDGRLRVAQYVDTSKKARCFFEWVYFSNVASEIDGLSVYTSRAKSGRVLAEKEDQNIDDNCVVVPVPDTAKGAADAYAHACAYVHDDVYLLPKLMVLLKFQSQQVLKIETFQEISNHNKSSYLFFQ